MTDDPKDWELATRLVRGGVIDVFCPLYDKPIRIELLGDLIEEIRPRIQVARPVAMSRMRSEVTGLVEEDGRVAGVRARTPAGDIEVLRCRRRFGTSRNPLGQGLHSAQGPVVRHRVW